MNVIKNVTEKIPLYCCGALQYQAEDEHCPVEYDFKWREYTVRDSDSTSRSLMRFCPNCGNKLPISLRDMWFDTLEEEYGLEDPLYDDKLKVPKEFMTDKWWQLRPLIKNKEDENIMPLQKPLRLLF
ncbi:MAG TPA: hypothetical protein VKU36_03100 [Candidatus Babeliales bacterium]|nr:hypothetical protein [Candidatus Babeliales bacterium]